MIDDFAWPGGKRRPGCLPPRGPKYHRQHPVLRADVAKSV